MGVFQSKIFYFVPKRYNVNISRLCYCARIWKKKQQTKVITIRNYGFFQSKIVSIVYSPDKGPQLMYDLKKICYVSD